MIKLEGTNILVKCESTSQYLAEVATIFYNFYNDTRKRLNEETALDVFAQMFKIFFSDAPVAGITAGETVGRFMRRALEIALLEISEGKNNEKDGKAEV